MTRQQAAATPDVEALRREGRGVLPGAEGAREVDLLLAHALGRDGAWLFAHGDHRPETGVVEHVRTLFAARAQGQPVAYLLGGRGFWTLDLAVSPATLIPRAETECLVEAALARLPPQQSLVVADLGTGSGAIALALASERPSCRLLAVDIDAGALALARGNAAALGLDNVEFRQGDWLAALAGERMAMIVSNPPYLAEDDPHLTQGDLRFEPRRALVSGVDGLDALRTIIGDAPAHLLPGGWLLLEHGLTQGAAVRDLLARAGFGQTQTLPDLEGRDRVSLGRLPG
ncbi:MAG: peptide chain release factor N(5)-glutamine methyltransferase [Lysobacteraceae bacterium]